MDQDEFNKIKAVFINKISYASTINTHQYNIQQYLLLMSSGYYSFAPVINEFIKNQYHQCIDLFKSVSDEERSDNEIFASYEVDFDQLYLDICSMIKNSIQRGESIFGLLDTSVININKPEAKLLLEAVNSHNLFAFFEILMTSPVISSALADEIQLALEGPEKNSPLYRYMTEIFGAYYAQLSYTDISDPAFEEMKRHIAVNYDHYKYLDKMCHSGNFAELDFAKLNFVNPGLLLIPYRDGQSIVESAFKNKASSEFILALFKNYPLESADKFKLFVKVANEAKRLDLIIDLSYYLAYGEYFNSLVLLSHRLAPPITNPLYIALYHCELICEQYMQRMNGMIVNDPHLKNLFASLYVVARLLNFNVLADGLYELGVMQGFPERDSKHSEVVADAFIENTSIVELDSRWTLNIDILISFFKPLLASPLLVDRFLQDAAFEIEEKATLESVITCFEQSRDLRVLMVNSKSFYQPDKDEHPCASEDEEIMEKNTSASTRWSDSENDDIPRSSQSTPKSQGFSLWSLSPSASSHSSEDLISSSRFGSTK